MLEVAGETGWRVSGPRGRVRLRLLTFLVATIFLLTITVGRYPSNGPVDPLRLSFWATFFIVAGYPALRMARIRCEGNQAAVATGLWNFLRPARVDWTQLDAIRLHIYLYSDGSEAGSIILEADDAVQFGRNLGEDQLQYVLWTLIRHARSIG